MLNKYLQILAIGYSIATFIEWLDFSATFHYLLFSLTYLSLSYLCSKYENKLILCYGLLNVMALFLCIPLIFADVELCLYLFHDATYGVGNMIISVELLMLGFGGYNAIIYFIDNWRDNGLGRVGRFMRNTKEA